MIKFIKALFLVLKIGPEKVLELIQTDPLTGLFNRRGFQEKVLIEVARVNRKKSRFLLVYLDLDDLKKINDLHGHHKGDEAIITFAITVKENLRLMDFAARVGGDEFLVVFSETTEESETAILKRLRDEIKNASIGSCHYDGSESIEEVLLSAERRMRRNKKERKKGRV